MTLLLTASGLLFADDFNRANGAIGANYTVASGTWVIDTNRLKHTIVRNGLSNMRLAAGVIAARAKMHVQVQISRDDLRSFVQVTTRGDANNFYYHDHAASDAGSGQASSSRVNRWAGGGTTNANLGFAAGPAGAAGVAERITAFVDVGVQKTWVNGGSLITTADASAANAINGTAGFMSFGQTSLGGNVFGYIDDLIVCADRTLTVTGLPAGYKIRANGLTSAAAVAATPLVLDLLGTLLPVALLEVLDGTNTVVDSTAVALYGGDTLAYTPPAQLSATLTLPLALSGFFSSGETLLSTLTLPLAVSMAIDAGRVLTSSLRLPLSLLASLSQPRTIAATLTLPLRLAGLLKERDKWAQVDLDPLSLWTTEQPTTLVNLGLGPVAGLPRNNVFTTANASGVFGGVRVTYDTVTVNPAGFAGANGETVQGGTGTGPAPVPPFTIRFSKPVRSFSAMIQQMTFYGGWMSAHDASGAEIGRVLYDVVAWVDHGVLLSGANATLVQTLDMGANLIYSIQLHPDPVDWAVWSDMNFLFNGRGTAWSEDDVAPATAWSTY